MSTLSKRSIPLQFSRHILAIIGSATLTATLFALLIGAAAAIEKGNGSIALMLAGATWLGVFGITIVVASLVYTLAWPLMRQADVSGWPASLLLGGAGGLGTMWANYALAGKACTARELEASLILGLVVGSAYWWIARMNDAH